MWGAGTAALVVAVALAAASCAAGQDDDNDQDTGRTFTEAGGVTKDPDRTGPAPDVPGAREGGTITVYLPGDPGPSSLDPTGAWYVPQNAIEQDLITRSLTQYARDPETGRAVLVPDLATDLGTPNEDLTEWTFTLRENATWQDDEPVTAEEMAFGIARSMDSEQFPGGAGTQYSQTYFHGAGDYAGPYSDPETDWATEWGGVTFDNDARTVTIRMNRPFGDMDFWGAFAAMGPVPLGHRSDPPDYGLMPMATGPYKVQSFRPNEELVLVRNEAWDPASDPARHQYVDSWVFKFDASQDQVDLQLLNDTSASQTSMTFTVGVNDYERLSSVLGDHLVQDPTTCVNYLVPDYDKIPDLEVRQAIGFAYPYEDAWTAGGYVPGVTDVHAGALLPPGMAGRVDYQPTGEPFAYDPDKARQLLSEAGYAPGEFELSQVYYEKDPLSVAAAKQSKVGYEAAGFSVKQYPVQVSPYDIWTDPDNELNQKLNLRALGWCSDWPSGLTVIPPILQSSATYNLGHFDEPGVDEEIDRISSLPVDEQADAWGALDQAIGTDYLPIIPSSYKNNLYGFGSRIGNPTGDTSIGAPNFKDLYVEEQGR